MESLATDLVQPEQARNELVSQVFNDAVSSPIQNLPPELLTEIFQWFLLANTDPFFNEPVFLKMDCGVWAWISDHPTLDLSWVCSLWRKLVTSQPTFWSSIFIDTSTDIQYPCEADVRRREMFLHYISLSGNAPLTFILNGNGPMDIESSDPHNASDVHFILDTMLDNLHRWGSVYLEIAGARSLDWLERFLEDKKPLPDQSTDGQGQTQIQTRDGEVIELQVPNLSHLWVRKTLPVQLLTTCPKIQSLEMYSLRLSEFSLCDFAGLRTLRTNYFYGTGVAVDVLRQTPLLEELQIGRDGVCIPDTTYISMDANRVPVLDPPYWSSLITLLVSVDCLWPGVWKNIIFPHLKSLTITARLYEPYISNAVMAELAEMLLLSFSQVQPKGTLSMPLGLQKVTFGGIPAPAIVNFLQSHPPASELTLASAFGKKVHDEIFTLLSAKPSFVIPNLRTLSLAGSSCRHYTYTDPCNVDTYSVSEKGGIHIPQDLCCLAEDLSSMIEAQAAAVESPSRKLQHLVLGSNIKCMDPKSLQDRLGPLGVTVVQEDDSLVPHHL